MIIFLVSGGVVITTLIYGYYAMWWTFDHGTATNYVHGEAFWWPLVWRFAIVWLNNVVCIGAVGIFLFYWAEPDMPTFFQLLWPSLIMGFVITLILGWIVLIRHPRAAST